VREPPEREGPLQVALERVRPCTQKTVEGRACAGVAVRGTDPPRCMVHKSSEAPRRRPRIKHGFYARQSRVKAGVDAGEFVRRGGLQAQAHNGCERHPSDPRRVSTDTAIANLVDKMKVMDALIQKGEQGGPDLVRLLELYSVAASRLSRMVRDRHYIEGQQLDERLELGLAEALDELSRRFPVEL
jgi:hypothetical protein